MAFHKSALSSEDTFDQQEKDDLIASIYCTLAERTGTRTFSSFESADFALSPGDTARILGISLKNVRKGSKWSLATKFGKLSCEYVCLPNPVELLKKKLVYNVSGCIVEELADGFQEMDNKYFAPQKDIEYGRVAQMFGCFKDVGSGNAYCTECNLCVNLVDLCKNIWPDEVCTEEEQEMIAVAILWQHVQNCRAVAPLVFRFPRDDLLKDFIEVWPRFHTFSEWYGPTTSTPNRSFNEGTDDEGEEPKGEFIPLDPDFRQEPSVSPIPTDGLNLSNSM